MLHGDTTLTPVRGGMRIALTYNLMRSEHPDEAEFDRPETIAGIRATLEGLGHDVVDCEVTRSVAEVAADLMALRPDLILNTSEGLRGRAREAVIPLLAEELGIACTGSDAHTCVVTLDKWLTKVCVATRGVPVVWGAAVRSLADLDTVLVPAWPVIAKPQYEGSSKGIGQDSVARDADGLRRIVARLLADFADGVLIEAYIDGDDIAVGYLAGASPETGGVLEPCSYAFGDAACMAHAIYDFAHKQHGDSVDVACPAPLAAEVRAAILRHSRQVIDVLGIRHLARLDWRVDRQGRAWFLEINALPSLEDGAAIFVAAAQAGLPTFQDFFAHLIAQATSNHTGSRQSGTPL